MHYAVFHIMHIGAFLFQCWNYFIGGKRYCLQCRATTCEALFSFAELAYDIELEALLVILSEKQRQKGGEDEIKNKTLAGRMKRKPYIFLSLHHTCIH